MKIGEKIRKFLGRLQGLPEVKKKIILWIIVIIMATILGFFWVRGAIYNFSKIGESIKSINLPSFDISDENLDESMQNLKKIGEQIKDINPDELKNNPDIIGNSK